ASAGLAAPVQFVETSPALRLAQQRAVPAARFHAHPETLPADRPLLVFANEFLDALPVTQFERNALGWTVRTVVAQGDRLAFQAIEPVKLAMIPDAIRDAAPGSVFERNFAAEQLVSTLARRLAAQGGAALVIDYGHLGPAIGDTLQAIRDGQPADPLESLGEGDVTAHVDFAAIAHAAARAGAAPFGVADQGSFLLALGLRQRAEALKAAASRETRAGIEAAAARLAGAGAMGRLFKALALVAPGWPEPAALPRFTP
ncbi:MAG: SAM-dependent methyltransferase, partial [Sphingomonadaceae bacterium]